MPYPELNHVNKKHGQISNIHVIILIFGNVHVYKYCS